MLSSQQWSHQEQWGLQIITKGSAVLLAALKRGSHLWCHRKSKRGKGRRVSICRNTGFISFSEDTSPRISKCHQGFHLVKWNYRWVAVRRYRKLGTRWRTTPGLHLPPRCPQLDWRCATKKSILTIRNAWCRNGWDSGLWIFPHP